MDTVTLMLRIFGRGPKEGVRIVGAVDPYPAGCRYLDQMKQLGIPIYDTLDDFMPTTSGSGYYIFSQPSSCATDHFSPIQWKQRAV